MKDIEFDYSKLRGRTVEKAGTMKGLAAALGINPATLSVKIHNKAEFTQREIMRACEVLEIEPIDIPTYFFERKV